MILEALTILLTGFGIYDADLTQARIKKYGNHVELNRVIRWLSTRMGPELACVLGIIVPTGLWAYVLFQLKATVVLGLIVGWRAKTFSNQVASYKLEQHPEFKRLLAAHRASEDATLPSGESTSSPEANSQERK